MDGCGNAALEPVVTLPAPATLVGFCRALPKAELHAHLNGSLRPRTLAELLATSGDGDTHDAHVAPLDDPQAPPAAAAAASSAPPRCLSDCFRVFSLAHRAVGSTAAVARVAREMIHDASADGVTYMEIRTTPRPLPTVEAYVNAVLGAIDDASACCGLGIVVRLLLSINRATSSAADADATVDLAIRYAARPLARPRGGPPCDECRGRAGGGGVTSGSPSSSDDGGAAARPAAGGGPLVVGVELSGDPTRGDARAFLPALARARAAGGLRVSVHCGEVLNEAEAEAVLDWRPDRLGHMCALAPATLARLLRTPPHLRIPVEVCPASNALTLGLRSLHHHPTLSPWLQAGYPLALCTDDPGVFGVTLSGEYADVAEAHGLPRERVASLALAAFEHAFVDAPTKARLVAAATATVRALLAS